MNSVLLLKANEVLCAAAVVVPIAIMIRVPMRRTTRFILLAVAMFSAGAMVDLIDIHRDARRGIESAVESDWAAWSGIVVLLIATAGLFAAWKHRAAKPCSRECAAKISGKAWTDSHRWTARV